MSFDDMNTEEFRNAKPADDGFPVLPKGEYEAIGVKYEPKNNPEKGGNYHSFTFQILSGEFKNQKMFCNFYPNSRDGEERSKSARKFASLKQATGVLSPTDGNELTGKPVRVVWDVMKQKDGGEAFGYVRNFKPRHSGPAANVFSGSSSPPPASGQITNPFATA